MHVVSAVDVGAGVVVRRGAEQIQKLLQRLVSQDRYSLGEPALLCFTAVCTVHVMIFDHLKPIDRSLRSSIINPATVDTAFLRLSVCGAAEHAKLYSYMYQYTGYRNSYDITP